MAIDMISEAPSLGTSPRISFSHNLCHTDSTSSSAASVFNDNFTNSSLLDSSSEFDFCINNNTDTETCSADELFSDGLIRTLQLQEKFVNPKQAPLSSKTQSLINSDPPHQDYSSPNRDSKQEITRKIATASSVVEPEQQKNQPTKSFWRINRSSSVHCVNTYKKSSFWSLPLLSRSNSTGSVSNSKQSMKENQKQSGQCKQIKNPASQKPPLRKNYGGPNYGNGIRINPVLNVPSSCISVGTTNLFGLGSLFRNGKEKKSKR